MTTDQKQLKAEFRRDYGVEISSFDKETNEPNFTYDNLQTLIYTMGSERINRTAIDAYFDHATEQGYAETTLELQNGQIAVRISRVPIGQLLTNLETIETPAQALGLAKLNSLRECLAAIGFNPLRIHNARKPQDQTPDDITTDNADELANEIDELAKQTGYIVEGVYVRLYTLVKAMYDANGTRSLTVPQLKNLRLFLRADLQAKARAHAA